MMIPISHQKTESLHFVANIYVLLLNLDFFHAAILLEMEYFYIRRYVFPLT